MLSPLSSVDLQCQRSLLNRKLISEWTWLASKWMFISHSAIDATLLYVGSFDPGCEGVYTNP